MSLHETLDAGIAASIKEASLLFTNTALWYFSQRAVG
jgi:hypothetical protein